MWHMLKSTGGHLFGAQPLVRSARKMELEAVIFGDPIADRP
jgi:hypothetical protein